jgi:DNA-binding protein HU-beta
VAFEGVVANVLKDGDEIQITGFGTFHVREQKVCEGKNPQAREVMTISAWKVPTFSAGNSLKESI